MILLCKKTYTANYVCVCVFIEEIQEREFNKNKNSAVSEINNQPKFSQLLRTYILVCLLNVYIDKISYVDKMCEIGCKQNHRLSKDYLLSIS